MLVKDMECPRCGHKGFNGFTSYDGATTLRCRGCNAEYTVKDEKLLHIPKYGEEKCPRCDCNMVCIEYDPVKKTKEISCPRCGKKYK